MKNKESLFQGILFSMALIAILWELMGLITTQRLAEFPKQLLAAALLCWLVLVLFRKPEDDDDWAGQY